MLKIKNKNNYETKCTTISGYCGKNYEENLRQFRKRIKEKRWTYRWYCNNKIDSNISRESRER